MLKKKEQKFLKLKRKRRYWLMKNKLKNGCTRTHFYLKRILLQSTLMTVQTNN